MSIEDWHELAAKLELLPGGAQAAIPDFFGAWLAQSSWLDDGTECWLFKQGGLLRLGQDGLLIHNLDGSQISVATCPSELLVAAHEAAVSPLLLALLAIAVGHIDDARRLKQTLPRVDGAAKDLMLMTVCRLCG